MASDWTVEITPTAGAGLEQLLEDYGEQAYRDALRDIIALEEDPTPDGAVRLRKTNRLIIESISIAPSIVRSTACHSGTGR